MKKSKAVCIRTKITYISKVKKRYEWDVVLTEGKNREIKRIFNYFDIKINAINCFKSQFYDPESKETESYISTKEFMSFIKSRSIEMGQAIGVSHGEGFTSENKLKINSLENFI